MYVHKNYFQPTLLTLEDEIRKLLLRAFKIEIMKSEVTFYNGKSGLVIVVKTDIFSSV